MDGVLMGGRSIPGTITDPVTTYDHKRHPSVLSFDTISVQPINEHIIHKTSPQEDVLAYMDDIAIVVYVRLPV